jgi:pimeloyl-ACP methyl ester carboxylesterase
MLPASPGNIHGVSTQLRDWPGVTDTFLEVNGRRIRALRAEGRGAGAVPQLLVHGLGGSSVGWLQVMEGLSARGPVVAIDLPGFGRTPVTADDPLTVQGYVALVLEIADSLGWHSFTLHGNSMGGIIGTLIAADLPSRIERLVLVSPAFPPRSPLGLLVPARATIDGMLPLAISSTSALALGAMGLAGPGLDQRRNRAMLKLIFADPDDIDPALMDFMAKDFAEGIDGADRRRALLSATRSITSLWADPRHAWRKIREVQAPTLLLGGTRDALVPARVLRAVLAERPDWEGHVLDDRRHVLMLEDPEAYLDLLDRFEAGERVA